MSYPYGTPKPYQPSERELTQEELARIVEDTKLIQAETRLKKAQAAKAEEEAKSATLRFERENLSLDRDRIYHDEAMMRLQRTEREDLVKKVGAGHNGVFFFDKEVRGDYGSANSLYAMGDELYGPAMDEIMAVVPTSFQPMAAKMADAFFGKKADTIRPLIAELTVWSEAHEGEPLELVINSPGGSVYAGWFLIGKLRSLSKAGHHVTTVVSGMAASMGGVIAQAGDTRVIEEESSLMIHEASSSAWGPAHTIRDTAEHLTDIGRQIRDLYVKRSGGKTTAEEFDTLWERRDRWIRSKEALDRGFVDEVR